MPRYAAWLLLVLGALPAAAVGEVMYARTSAPVRAARTLGAATLATLAQAEAVQVTGRETGYFRVSYRGQVGWVYFNKLTLQRPENVSALLSRGLPGGAIKLTELEAGGALRGLSPMAENYAREAAAPAWAVKAVEDMQGRAVTPGELERFQQEGGLGEYAQEGAR